jgi:para-aminobenzoate synthetase
VLPLQRQRHRQLYTTRLLDRKSTHQHGPLYYQPNSQPLTPSTHQEEEEIVTDQFDQRKTQSTTSPGSELTFQSSNSSNIKQTYQKLDNLRILLIDNHDSYTYNLFQYLSTMTTHPVKVLMNDAFSTLDDFLDSLLDERSSSTSSRPNRSSNDDANSNLLKQHFDCIVLSPGPGQPSHPSDMGIVLDTILYSSQIPILGVCLGHQALGYVYGNQVTLAPCGPVHGLMSSVRYSERQHHSNSNGDCNNNYHEEDELSCQLFRGIQQDFKVVRYHSLVVNCSDSDSSNESDIEPIAWCQGVVGKEEEDHSNDIKICMALRHKRYPHFGVQFHPESIGTGEAGYQLIWNFCDFAYQYKLNKHVNKNKEGMTKGESMDDATSFSATDMRTNHVVASKPSRHRIYIHKLEKCSLSSQCLPEDVFQELFSTRENSFWLDSSTATRKLDTDQNFEGCPIISNSRFSIMGSDDGPLSRKVEYFGIEHPPEKRKLSVVSNSGNVETSTVDTDILTYLRQTLIDGGGLSNLAYIVSFNETKCVEVSQTLRVANDDEIPFDYRGGYIGYLGYELRHITQCSLFEQEGGSGCDQFYVDNGGDASIERTNPNVPTAAFLFADRSLLFDHYTNDWYTVGVASDDEEVIDDALNWMRGMPAKIKEIGRKTSTSSKAPYNQGANNIDGIQFVPNRSKDQYKMDIARSHEEIRNGESYELCVTNQLEAEITLPKRPEKESHESPFNLYKILRTNNPAPFSAFMNFHRTNDADASSVASASLSICCSSPERFLSVKQDLRHQNFVVESKPIKGTIARYIGADGEKESSEMVKMINDQIIQELRESTKDQAENLMIVDLLRNDLGRVCEVGSVHVPHLMSIESFATVHQMVSTVRGTLDGNTSNAIDVIEACFPGGSMTGAPKQRAMEILNEIEEGVSRGPYSGCLGYISLNGCMDMNIIIRSAILTPIPNVDDSKESWKASIGCGGAITALSDSNDEYEEMMLKSRIVRRSISQWAQQYSSAK